MQLKGVDTMEGLVIANMELCYIDAIMVIENLSFRIPWSRRSFVEELTTNKFAIYIVAKIEEQVVGYAGMWQIIDEGHITNIAVHPDFRGKKIATQMVSYLIDYSKENGISKLTLEVRKSNIGAQKLYENFGFEEAGFRKRYYADNQEDALIMWKVV